MADSILKNNFFELNGEVKEQKSETALAQNLHLLMAASLWMNLRQNFLKVKN